MSTLDEENVNNDKLVFAIIKRITVTVSSGTFVSALAYILKWPSWDSAAWFCLATGLMGLINIITWKDPCSSS